MSGNERPVEELIGWKRVPIRGELRGFDDPVWDPGSDGIATLVARAEVDDLAAWLGDRLIALVKIGSERVVVEVKVTTGVKTWFHAHVYGDTIRDALIAAVRKVAAQ